MNTSAVELNKTSPESEVIDLTKKDLKALSLEVKQHPKKFASYEDLDLGDYLDEDMKKNDIKEIKLFLDPNKIKENEKEKSYQYGDILIRNNVSGRKLNVKSNNSTYFRGADRINDLASPLVLTPDNSLADCERLTAFLNYVAYFMKGKKTGTDNIGDVELDNFGSNLVEDNNPFYASGDNLYFNNGGKISDITIISQNSLDRMVKGVKLEDLAKFFTNRVKYTFDNE